MNFPDKKYKVIYADPPWEYEQHKTDRRGLYSKYSTLSVEDICNLPVKKIADDDCILFCWGTWTHINEIQQVIKAWGFIYKTLGFIWIKTYPNIAKFTWGMGNWTRSNSEYCLIAIKGKPKRQCADISQVITSSIKKHSQKPDEVRKRILKLCGDIPRIELFARTKVHGWDVWGNDEKLESQPLEAFL